MVDSSSPKACLSATGLSFDYPRLRAVDDCSLELRAGELLALLGPNGSGKSTLLRLLAGLLTPRTGAVAVAGERLETLDDRERARRIAVVPQGLLTVPDVRVEDFVLGGRYAHLGSWRRPGEADLAVVERVLETVDFAGEGDRLLTQLSGGQRQRVLVARALAQDAGILLVDEPTTSLDPPHQVATFDLLARATCEGKAVLVVTHELNLASQFATRLALMNNARIVATGTPDEVLRSSVLEPVYGPHLRYGTFPGPRGGALRPFVVPWFTEDA